MALWDEWKKGFDAWEASTAKVVEEWMKSPFVVGPSGAMLSTAVKMKNATDAAKAAWWAEMGLPTKRDQERILHMLNTLESRIMDLEEKIESR
jgi:hypothetical protein